MKRCPTCQGTDTDQVNFCHADGTTLEATGVRTLADVAHGSPKVEVHELVVWISALARALEPLGREGRSAPTVCPQQVEIPAGASIDHPTLVVTLSDVSDPDRTAAYRAPEAARGAASQAAVQVYNLGAIAYELWTRERPLESSTAAAVAVRQLLERPRPTGEIRPGLPAAVEAVILQSLARDPAVRFASPAAFAKALCDAETWTPRQPGSATAATPPLVPHPPAAHATARARSTGETPPWWLFAMPVSILLAVGGWMLWSSTALPRLTVIPASYPRAPTVPAPVAGGVAQTGFRPRTAAPVAAAPPPEEAFPVRATAHSPPDGSVLSIPLLHPRSGFGSSNLPLPVQRRMPSVSGRVVPPRAPPPAPPPAPPVSAPRVEVPPADDHPTVAPAPVETTRPGTAAPWLVAGCAVLFALGAAYGGRRRRRVVVATTPQVVAVPVEAAAVPPTRVTASDTVAPVAGESAASTVGTEPTLVSHPSSEATVRCPGCGTEAPANAAYCPQDGRRLRNTGPVTGLHPVGEGGHDDVPQSFQVGQYLCSERLGEGGMGVVYKAHHVLLDRPAAVKVLFVAGARHASFVDLFRREAKLAASISHPHSVTIYDYGEAGASLLYLAMEYLDGGTLAERMRAGPMPLARVVDVVRQVASALDVAHALGIVHRDLKPQNLMVNGRSPGTEIVKVVDFGIARAISQGDVATSVSGMVVGTPTYMAPEQARGEPDVDPRADVFSLAVVAWELLAGSLPFPVRGLTPMQQIVQRGAVATVLPALSGSRPELGLPAAVDSVLREGMAFDRAQRTPSAGAFAEALARAAGQ